MTSRTRSAALGVALLLAGAIVALLVRECIAARAIEGTVDGWPENWDTGSDDHGTKPR